MRRPRFTILALLLFTLAVACILAMHVPTPHETNRVEHAQREECALIFQRCKNIPELQQFIKLHGPEVALESFDGGQVVSVTCVTPIDDRYTATFDGPVVINDSGTYDLNGDLKFRIEDHNGKFITNHADGSSTSPAVVLNATEWAEFVARGADIESIRVINRTRGDQQNSEEE